MKKGGHVIRTVAYVDHLVSLAMEETVLRGIIDELIGFVRYCGVEQLENVGYFNCLGCMKSNEVRCKFEIKSRTVMVI